MLVPHETTARDFNYARQLLILAESWGESALLKVEDGNEHEAGYAARCAAHFFNIYTRKVKQ